MATIQESRTHDLIQSACKKYIDHQKKIDWEQRRYEIAKEVFVGMCVSGHFTQNLANESVQVADDLISVLKNR